MSTVQEILPAAKALSKAERLQLIQLLVEEMALEEQNLSLRSDIEYPIWTPLEAYSASATLQKLLEEDKARG